LVENKLIEHIINETIDDVISQLPQGEKRKRIEEIRNKVSHYFDRVYNELVELLKEKEHTERKEFALKHKEHPYFGVLMKAKNETELEKLLKEKIIRDTSRLTKAREFLKNL
jgi:phosphotransacetylase